MIRRVAFALGVALALAACGDDSTSMPIDAPMVEIDAGIDAPIDAAPDAPTFTDFVIDQIQNHTASDTDPVPATEFATLPDPDSANPDAYDALFP